MIDVFIEATPAPGGSKQAFPMRDRTGNLVCKWIWSKRFGRKIPMPAIRIVDDAGKRNKQWRAAVEAAARLQYDAAPLDGPLRVLFRFHVRRPKHHHVAGKRSRELKADAPAYPTGPPDAIKFARSTEDALTGILWTDDSIIVQEYIEKVYAASHEPEGCRVMVTAVIPDHAPEGLFSQEAMA